MEPPVFGWSGRAAAESKAELSDLITCASVAARMADPRHLFNLGYGAVLFCTAECTYCKYSIELY